MTELGGGEEADSESSTAPAARDPSASRAAASEKPTTLGFWGRALWVLVWLLPKNAISRGAGRFASLRLPAAIQRAEIRAFARLAGVDLSEAAEPIEAYPSLQRFFTRALKAGARPIAGDASVLVSPCDGTWGASGTIDGGTLTQVKGRNYRVRDLLGDIDVSDLYEGGYFATLYLSPRDYHRLHTPTAGRIRRLDYWPGALWPVNPIGLLGVDQLFAVNERICAYLDPDAEPSPTARGLESEEIVSVAEGDHMPRALAMVAVGATMVGSVRLAFSDLTTNQVSAPAVRRDLGAGASHFERGGEWGHFEFGSTIVLLIPPETFELETSAPGTPVRLGERIGLRVER